MANEYLFQKYKKAFESSYKFLLDIYVFKTDENDWQTIINYLRLNTLYTTTFLVDQKKQTLPFAVKEIFDLTQDHAIMLRIDEGQLNLYCYFFTPEQIEFDFDPRDITDDQRLTRLLDFIHLLGKLLQKQVVLTAESNEEIHYLSYDPITQNDTWSLPEWKTD